MDINSFVIGYKKGKASAPTGGGGSVENANTVTFMSEDGATVLYQLPVLDGNTCADVVAQGIIATPTKNSTAQYDYTYSGWSLTRGGAANQNALFNVTEDRTVYVAYARAVRYYTITFYDGDTVLKTESLAYGTLPSFTPEEKEGYIFQRWEPEIETVKGDATYYAQYVEGITTHNSSWAKISEISEAGLAQNYFAVGDTKEVAIQGKVGVTSIDTTLLVYIIGFDHNSEIEGNGIHFGTFKTTDGKDIALVDHKHGSITGIENYTKYFNMRHNRNSKNASGWRCAMRGDILGSSATDPVNAPTADTLLAALPADLRAVMKPMTKYTDCTGGGTDVEENVVETIDYLPLLAEFEVFGERKYANQYEQNKQKQYEYFAAGGKKTKMRHSSVTSKAYWWTRSPYYGDDKKYCKVNYDGYAGTEESCVPLGVAPIFKV